MLLHLNLGVILNLVRFRYLCEKSFICFSITTKYYWRLQLLIKYRSNLKRLVLKNKLKNILHTYGYLLPLLTLSPMRNARRSTCFSSRSLQVILWAARAKNRTADRRAIHRLELEQMSRENFIVYENQNFHKTKIF